MMHLHEIYILLARIWRLAAIVDELTAYFEKHLNTVDQEEDQHDQQQDCIAAVEEIRVCFTVFDDLRGEHLCRKQAVWKNVEGQKSKETL